MYSNTSCLAALRVIERLEGKEEIFAKLMNDDGFRHAASEGRVKRVYDSIVQAGNNQEARDDDLNTDDRGPVIRSDDE